MKKILGKNTTRAESGIQNVEEHKDSAKKKNKNTKEA